MSAEPSGRDNPARSLDRPGRRAVASLAALTAAALPLGIGMAFDGLHARLFGGYIPWPGPVGLWTAGAEQLGLNPLSLAWPLIFVGTAWIGGVSALWLGLGWGYRVSAILAVVSLAYLWPGTILGVVILALLWSARRHRWTTPPPE